MTQGADIRGFHAHVYFDAITRPTAERIHDALPRHLGVNVGALHARPVGPHAKAMFQVTITPEQFATVVPWLMANRSGLSVFVHPTMDDSVADHQTNSLWMGEPLPIDVEVLRCFVKSTERRLEKSGGRGGAGLVGNPSRAGALSSSRGHQFDQRSSKFIPVGTQHLYLPDITALPAATIGAVWNSRPHAGSFLTAAPQVGGRYAGTRGSLSKASPRPRRCGPQRPDDPRRAQRFAPSVFFAAFPLAAPTISQVLTRSTRVPGKAFFSSFVRTNPSIARACSSRSKTTRTVETLVA